MWSILFFFRSFSPLMFYISFTFLFIPRFYFLFDLRSTFVGWMDMASIEFIRNSSDETNIFCELSSLYPASLAF